MRTLQLLATDPHGEQIAEDREDRDVGRETREEGDERLDLRVVLAQVGVTEKGDRPVGGDHRRTRSAMPSFRQNS